MTLRATKLMLKLVVREQAAQGKRLLLQSFTMMCNNLIAFAAFAIIFHFSPVIRGWTIDEYMIIYALAVIAFGIMSMFFEGTTHVSETIATGALDSYLSRPQSPIIPLCLRRPDISGFGDVLTGIVMLCLVSSMTAPKLGLIMIMLLCCTIIFWSITFIIECTAFYGASQGMLKGLANTVVLLKSSPPHGMPSWMKAITLTVFPAGLINIMPPTILNNPDRWDYWVAFIVSTISLFVLAIAFFHIGLRKYTSGNQITTIQ